MELNIIFGGGNLVVPAWGVRVEMTNVLGGLNDRRTQPAVIDCSPKVLLLIRSLVFSGITIY